MQTMNGLSMKSCFVLARSYVYIYSFVAFDSILGLYCKRSWLCTVIMNRYIRTNSNKCATLYYRLLFSFGSNIELIFFPCDYKASRCDCRREVWRGYFRISRRWISLLESEMKESSYGWILRAIFMKVHWRLISLWRHTHRALHRGKFVHWI